MSVELRERHDEHQQAGVKHQVEVNADSLLEAAALGLAAMNREEWVDGTGPGATLEISVSSRW